VGVVVGEGGIIFGTDDSSTIWQEETSGVSQSLRGVHWLAGQRPFAVGGSGALLRRDQ
jgi:hypothetical protein